MADNRSDKEFYREYLRDHPEREASPWTKAIAAAGLIGGGYAAYRAGALRPLAEKLIGALGNYRSTKMGAVNDGIRNWTNREFKGARFRYQMKMFQKDIEDSVAKFERRRLDNEGKDIIGDKMGSLTYLLTERNKVISSADGMWSRLSENERKEALTRYGTKENWKASLTSTMDSEIMKRNTITAEQQAEHVRQTGYRFATLKDVLDSGQLESNQDATLRMGITDLGQEFENKVFDHKVLINARTNKFVDMRDFAESFTGMLDMVADDFTVPFVKINPVRMLYLNQFTAKNRTPVFEILERTTIQPAITKNVDALGTDLLFTGGRVVSMTNFDEVITDNVRLVDAKAGPVARYYRNMTGASTSRYQEPNTRWGKIKYNTGQIFDVGFQDEPIGRDISWNFGVGANSFEAPKFTDPTTWPSYVAKKTHNLLKPYDGVRRIYLEEAFGKDARFLVFNNYRNVEEAGGYRNFMKQFTAGRQNLDEVTTASLFPYGFFERLNSTLNQVGLGLSNQNLGSAFDIAKNLFLRRFLPVIGVVEGWQYANTVSDQFLGFQFEDEWAKFYAGASTDVAALRDATGITDWAKNMAHLLPGGEQIAEIPFIGKFFDMNATEEETREYWENGEDPVRKGRFWEFGNTPYTGAKIEYFQPNWVRRTLSDYQYTDSLYGSREEYFENTWYPTPTNPLAPIRHFFTDPYHWEKKHYYDRPYMMTNGFSEFENVPLVGPVVNNVLSFFLKPNTPMHTEYWQASRDESGELSAPYMSGDLLIPSFDDVSDDYVVDPIANRANGGESFSARQARMNAQAIAAQNVETHQLNGDGQVVRADRSPAEEAGAATQSAAYITASGNVQSADVSAGMIRSLNERLKEKGLVGVAATTGQASMPRISDGAPLVLPNEDVMLQSEAMNMIGNMHYNLTEMGGAYGFFSTLAVDGVGQGPVLADPNDMTSFKRTFWDMNIGNIGGDANEIFRRFLPKDRTQEKYNPIPNQMPSWMPGENYFIDFQHGDPYTKVAKGEMRLPGEGYEALYGIEVDDDLSLGASFLGKEIPDMVTHMLRRDEIKDEDEQYVLNTGSDWHLRWEAEMQREGIALDFEQYVKVPEFNVGGFYDVKADHARWLEKAMEEADVFKYYSNSGGADQYAGFYDEGTDIKALQQQNPDAFREFILDSLNGAPTALIDPKTMSSEKYSQDEMFFNNVQQVNFYLYATGQKRGYLMHVDRADIEDGDKKEGMKVYAFDYNPELLEYSMSKVNAAREHIKTGMKDGSYGRADFYDMIDRFRILADVAPYSQEYRDLQKSIRSWEYLTEEQRVEVNQIEDQVSAKKENIRLYPYRFKTSDIERKQVTVREVLDNNNFLIEGSNNPIRLAGIRVPTGKDDPAAEQARRLIGLKPGMKITIGVDADEASQINNDTYQSISAVVYNKGININRQLIEANLGKERENDFTPAAVHARFSDSEIMLGSMWESIAHLDTPYNTKLLQVRSPLESYQRREVYNKDWQDWGDPVNDFFIPWYQNIISKNPVPAMIMGTLLGSAFGNTRYGKLMGAVTGLALSAIGVSYVQAFEATHDRAWIPQRRIQEREMFEYLDKIKYVKYRRLYEEAADEARKQGFNVRQYIADKQAEGGIRTEEKRQLQSIKRRLRTGSDRERAEALQEAESLGFGESGDIVKEINARLNEIASTRQLESIPDAAAKAITYHAESEKTMYAYDPGDPLADFLAALPKKERDYLVPFMEAPEEERQEILDVAPDYMRRVLQASYGMEVDEKEDIDEYFRTHGLPDEDWIGWDERASLKDLKVKMVKKHGLPTDEFDIWPDDTKQAAMVNMPAPNMHDINSTREVEARLRDVLQGIGLENVIVNVTRKEQQDSISDIRAQIAVDRREEIRQRMREEAANLI